MRLTHGAILLLSVVFQTFIFHLPKLTYGNQISDGDNQDNVQGRLDVQLRFTSRSLVNDDTCANACEAESVSSFKVSFQPGSLMLETEDEDATGSSGFLSRITGFLGRTKNVFGRLMNNLFKILNRSKDDDPKYMISTEYVIPFLSTYSAKFKSLAAMIRQESESDAALSTKPDAIQMMYNISAMNMEAVATVLDPILNDMRQSKTIDIRTMSCNMMQILTLLRDVTVPNIQSITKLIYTATSNNAEMRDVFNDYTGTISNDNTDISTSLMNESSSEKGICPDTSGKTASSGLFDDGILDGLLLLLFGPCGGCDDDVDVGPLGHIAAIVLLIVLFPLSIVASIVVGSALLLFGLVNLLFPKEPDDMSGGNDDWYGGYLLAITLLALIGGPFFVAFLILVNIREFFEDIFNPQKRPTVSPTFPVPTRAPVTPTSFTRIPYSRAPGSPVPVNRPSRVPTTFAPLVPVLTQAPNTPMLDPLFNSPINPPPGAQNSARRQTSELTHHLSAVLESPIDTIVNAVRNAKGFLDAGTEKEEEMDCEMAALKCKNDALIEILPF